MKAVDRAAMMLRVVAQYMHENPIAAECTTFYDEATCDGSCIADDCLAAAEALDWEGRQ